MNANPTITGAPAIRCALIRAGPVRMEDGSMVTLLPDTVGYLTAGLSKDTGTVEVFLPVPGVTCIVAWRDVELLDPCKYAGEGARKICIGCFRLLPISEFPYNQNRKDDGRKTRPRCKPCHRRVQGKPLSDKKRERFLERFGPKPGDLWRCPWCRKYSIAYVNVSPVVHHDHDTGEPREIVCDSCNTGTGRFGDDPNNMRYVADRMEDEPDSQQSLL